MRRRSVLLTLAILLFALAAGAGLLAYFASQEPAYYAAAVKEDNAPAQMASEVLTRFNDVQTEVRMGKAEWGASFTAQELNAILRDQFEEGGLFGDLLPEGVQSPRVAIEDGRLKIAARYRPLAGGGPEWASTVLSVELKVWVVKAERNTVAVEICGLYAGDVPVGSQRYLDRLGEAARKANIEVTWYRSDGNPVALMRFYADQPSPTTLVRTLAVKGDTLSVGGQSLGQLPAAPAGER